MSTIEGKVVAITGASSGIGEAAAMLLFQRGAKVVVGARRGERLEKLVAAIEAQGGEARFRTLDVTSREDMKAFTGFGKAEFGRADILVNNAGIMPLSPMTALKVDEWDRMIDVNIRGVLNGIAAVLPDMKARADSQCSIYWRPRCSADRGRLLCYEICRVGDLRRLAPGKP
jgi:NADP-dependent 3-hydroxy acid dehydrogenase YdfG